MVILRSLRVSALTATLVLPLAGGGGMGSGVRVVA